MSERYTRSTLLVAMVAMLVAPGLAGRSGWAVAQDSQIVAGGQAFGAFVKVEGVASAQKISLVGLGCSIAPAFKEEAAPLVDLAPVLTAGQIHSTARRTNTGTMIWERTTSTIEDVSLLGGLISATAVKAVSTASLTDDGFNAHGNGSEFVGLEVAGIPIGDTPSPNTHIDLLGFGHVTLNERAFSFGPDHVRQNTIMLHVVITIENPLVPVGTEIIIASAGTQIRSIFGTGLGGIAHAGEITVGDAALLGKLYAQGLPCTGTDGAWFTNAGAVTGLPGVLSAGEVVSRVKGTVSPTSLNGITESTIEDVNVLSGLVTVDAIKSWSRVARSSEFFVRQVFESEFVGLQVAGFPEITDDVPLNTKLDILGLGTLWLKRKTTWGGAVQMRMIDLEILEENDFGLPIGARISVGVTAASAKAP